MKIFTLKQLSTYVLFLAILPIAKAQITVNNNPNLVADYRTIQEAIDAATPGDYIYVQHSETAYGDANVNKKVHLRGRSHSLEGYITKAGIIRFEKGSDGSTIQGFRSDIRVEPGQNETVKDVIISNNYITNISFFGGASNSKHINIVVRGNIIDDAGRDSFMGGEEYINFVFSNNICMKVLSIFNSPNITVSNNIFRTIRPVNFINKTNKEEFTIKNCVFLANSGENISITRSGSGGEEGGKIIFENCVVYNYNSKGTFVFGADNDPNVELVNCLENTNPQFVNVNPNGDSIAGPEGVFNPLLDNLKLQANAPIPNAGVYYTE